MWYDRLATKVIWGLLIIMVSLWVALVSYEIHNRNMNQKLYEQGVRIDQIKEKQEYDLEIQRIENHADCVEGVQN